MDPTAVKSIKNKNKNFKGLDNKSGDKSEVPALRTASTLAGIPLLLISPINVVDQLPVDLLCVGLPWRSASIRSLATVSTHSELDLELREGRPEMPDEYWQLAVKQHNTNHRQHLFVRAMPTLLRAQEPMCLDTGRQSAEVLLGARTGQMLAKTRSF
jgi:hypothetical protein